MKIDEVFKKYGYELNDAQKNQFEKYYQFLITENEKYNLTAITEKNDVYLKHFLDSIFGIENIAKNSKIIDIGSGAGFPAVPIKIMRPDVEICMVDSLQKRVNFLNELIKMLNLEKTSAVHSRAEDFIKENRGKSDYATARAVAPLNTLLEYLLPYVKIGGKCLIYKSKKLDEELRDAQNALNTLGGKVECVKKFNFEEIESERDILIVKKVCETPAKYPRGKNLPKIKPL